MFLPDNLLLLLCVQGTHLQKSYGFTTEMRSRSQRTSTSSRKVAGTACVSRRCSQRTRAHTPVRPGTVLGRSAPGPYSLCKVKLGCFEGLGVQLLPKPFSGEGHTADYSSPTVAQRQITDSIASSRRMGLPSLLQGPCSFWAAAKLDGVLRGIHNRLNLALMVWDIIYSL